MSGLEQRLREELPGLVPDPPVAPDRAGRARAIHVTRVRRRTAAAVVGVVAAVGAIAGSLVLTGGGAPEPVAPVEDFACPERITDLGGSGPLGEDPVAVRLCAWEGASSLAIQEPVDALVEGADRLARSINDQPEIPDGGQGTCSGNVGFGFLLVFRFPDGSERAVIGSDYGCAQLQVVGGPAHTDPGAIRGAFADALHAQRARTDPPAGVIEPALTCGEPVLSDPDDPAPISLADITEVDRALVCFQRYRSDGASSEGPRRVELTADELARVAQDWTPGRRGGQLTTGACAVGPEGVPPGGRPWLLGATPWGEVLRADLCASLSGSDENAALVETLATRAVPEQ